MITDLATAVTTVSPEELDKLFEGIDTQSTGDTSKVKVQPDEKKPVPNNKEFDVPFVDLDKLEDTKEGTDDKKEKDDDKKDDKGDKTDKKDDIIVKDDKKESVEGKDDKKGDKKDDKKDEPDTSHINELLQNSVAYLIEKGIFKDFEGRADTEITEEFFAELLEKQAEAKAEELYLEKKKQGGEFGEAILEYLEKGGEPDKMIDLFKERKAIETFDIKDDDSKKELINKWYKEVHGWKSDRIKKFVDGLISEDGALDTEAEEIKQKYEDNYNKQIQALREEQEATAKEQKKRQKVFEDNITKAITDNKEFDDKRKRFIKDSVFKFKTLDDGTKVNDFYIRLAETQSDPQKYVDLIEFIMDKEGYLKRKAVEIENKVVDKTFKFLKGNGALDKSTKSKHVEKEPDTNKDFVGTNFSGLF